MLSVYESGYFMIYPAGGFQEAQKYYTDQNADFDNAKVGSLNNTVIVQNDSFSLVQLSTKKLQPQMERGCTRTVLECDWI
jgi:hypothetical protein